MPRNIPIETALGHLNGRDCIYLDGFAFEDGTGNLVLGGCINGNLETAAHQTPLWDAWSQKHFPMPTEPGKSE